MEKWLKVPRFPDYEVSDAGRIRRATPGRSTYVGKILRQGPDRDGYLLVILRRDGKSHAVKVGRAVCEAFHGAPPSPDHQAAHNDGNPTNNVKSNVRWATRLENCADIAKHDRHKRGERSYKAQLTEEIVREIRAAQNGPRGRYAALARKHGVRPWTIHMVAAGKSWKHVT